MTLTSFGSASVGHILGYYTSSSWLAVPCGQVRGSIQHVTSFRSTCSRPILSCKHLHTCNFLLKTHLPPWTKFTVTGKQSWASQLWPTCILMPVSSEDTVCNLHWAYLSFLYVDSSVVSHQSGISKIFRSENKQNLNWKLYSNFDEVQQKCLAKIAMMRRAGAYLPYDVRRMLYQFCLLDYCSIICTHVE